MNLNADHLFGTISLTVVNKLRLLQDGHYPIRAILHIVLYLPK